MLVQNFTDVDFSNIHPSAIISEIFFFMTICFFEGRKLEKVSSSIRFILYLCFCGEDLTTKVSGHVADWS